MQGSNQSEAQNKSSPTDTMLSFAPQPIFTGSNWDHHRDSTSADDLKRYEEQKVLVSEIVAKFETPTYADSNAGDREYIVERMQKVSESLLWTRQPTASWFTNKSF